MSCDSQLFFAMRREKSFAADAKCCHSPIPKEESGAFTYNRSSSGKCGELKMNPQRKRLVRFFVIMGISLTVVLSAVQFASRIRQARLDHELIEAIKKSDARQVAHLLDHGANANAVDDGGKRVSLATLWSTIMARLRPGAISPLYFPTALHVALSVRFNTEGDSTPSLTIVRALLSRGANPNVRDAMGRTSLERISNPQRQFEDQYLAGAIMPQSDDADCELALIHAGANVGIDEALICASDPSVMRALLAAGANVNAHTPEGYTPLMLGAQWSDGERVRFLLDHGADVNAGSNQGTVLLLSSYGGVEAVVNLLIERGADVRRASSDGVTPVMAAASRGHLNIVKILLAHGADIQTRDRNGWTALALAANSRERPTVAFLLSRGADLNIHLGDGKSLLEEMRGWEAGGDLAGVIALLKHAGAH